LGVLSFLCKKELELGVFSFLGFACLGACGQEPGIQKLFLFSKEEPGIQRQCDLFSRLPSLLCSIERGG
jgi:hypothetical protein